MFFNLKSLKTLQIFPNGCLNFSSSVYLKSFEKYKFFKKSLVTDSSKLWQPRIKHSNFFYLKYRDQIFKSIIDEFTITYKKY